MNKILKSVFKLLFKLLIVALGIFVATFAVYFFNLDMKLTSKMEPLLNWFYDRVDRDQHL